MPAFNDPIWGVIGVISTILFGIVAIIGTAITFLQLVQNRRGLSYLVTSITPVLSIQPDYKEQVEIRFNSAPVDNVFVIKLYFRNTGKTAIRATDFERPLKISFHRGNIMQASIARTEPVGLGNIIASTNKTSISIKKTLLNPRDYFELSILVSDFSGSESDILIDGRIEGVNEIKRLRRDSSFGGGLTSFFVGVIVAGFLRGFGRAQEPKASDKPAIQEILVREDFEDETLSLENWEVHENGGTIQVKTGELRLTTIKAAKSFPLLIWRLPIMPKGWNFSIRIGFQYTAVGPHGSGIILSNGIPRNLSDDVIEGHRIWQDVATRIPEDNRNTTPDLDYHEVEFKFEDEFDECVMDNMTIYKKSRDKNLLRPTAMIFGNNTMTSTENHWSSFKVKFIEVRRIP